MTEVQSFFGLTGEQIIFFKAQTIANGDFVAFKMNVKDGLDYFKKLCRSLSFAELSAKTLSNSFYLRCQNTLLEKREFPLEALQTLPPFNEFGRMNLTLLLQAWEAGGESELEQMYWEIFSDSWETEKETFKPIERKLFQLRSAAFNKYQTVQRANHLIDQIGLENSVKLSTEEFLEKLEIRISRTELTEDELYGLVVSTVAFGQWETVGLSKNEALNLIKDFCKNIYSNNKAEDVARSVYYSTQNGLMAFRKDDFYTIQREPPFSDFGRENLIRLIAAWEENGEDSLEQMFNQIFSQAGQERTPQQQTIEILSGDGESIENPLKFSTNDIEKRVRAENWYLNYQFGKEGQNWERGIHRSTIQPNTYKMISGWSIEFPDGTSKNIYFDTNRDD